MIEENMKSVADIRRENLRKICEAYESQAYVANKLNYDEQRISRLLATNNPKTQRNIGPKVAPHIEKVFNLPRYWLDHCNTMSKEALRSYLDFLAQNAKGDSNILNNQSPSQNIDFTMNLNKSLNMDFIPYFDLESSSHQNKLVVNTEDKMVVSADFMQRMELKPGHAGGVKIKGSLMEPYLKDKSEVVIDFDKNQIESGKIYLIKLNNEYIIRRLYEELPNNIRIACDNQMAKLENPDITLDAQQASKILEICGKIIWIGIPA